MQEYSRLQRIIRELHRSCQNDDGSDDLKKGTQLLEVHAPSHTPHSPLTAPSHISTLATRFIYIPAHQYTPPCTPPHPCAPLSTPVHPSPPRAPLPTLSHPLALFPQVYALEIQMYTETKNNKKLKSLYNKALQIKSAIPHPKIMGVIRECGGKMHMGEREWESMLKVYSAQSDMPCAPGGGTACSPLHPSQPGFGSGLRYAPRRSASTRSLTPAWCRRQLAPKPADVAPLGSQVGDGA